MCTVDKMLIKGIRSFSPDNQNVIEFYKPLTLIVGSNGAGKTTIIECLRQACTGEMPPNTGGNGRNWVMDPKVAGESEVKAQVKLRFKTSTGMPVVVARSYQSVQRRTGQPQFKSLDAVLQSYNKTTNEKQALTYKCADINTAVPALMGVNKAVLDNVIFVHQEESNWPLADGATLKKKFDEIFSATKYTKFLENIRKLKTEKAQAVKELKLQLETLKAHKDAAHKLRSAIAAGTAKAERYQENVAGVGAQVEEVMRRMAEVDGKLTEITAAEDKIAKLEAQISVVEVAVSEKLSALAAGDFEDPTDAMEGWLARSHQEVREHEGRVAQLDREVNQARLQAEKMKEQHTQAAVRLGHLRAEAEQYQRNTQERDRFVWETAARLGIHLPSSAAAAAAAAGDGSDATPLRPGVYTPLPPLVIEGFRSDLMGRRAQVQQELESARLRFKGEDDALNQQLDAAHAELSRNSEKARMAREQQGGLRAKMEGLQIQLQALSVNLSLVEELRGRELELQQLQAAKKAEEARGSEEGELARIRGEVEGLQRQVATLRSERDRLTAASESALKLRLKVSELSSKQEELRQVVESARGQQLLGLAGVTREQLITQAVSGPQVKSQAEAALRAKQVQVEGQRVAVKKMEHKASQMSGELSALRSELAGKEARVDLLREQLRQGLMGLHPPPAAELQAAGEGGEGEVFNNAVEKRETKLEKVEVKLRGAQAADALMNEYKVRIMEEEGCPLCTRPWNNNERDICLAKIEDEIQGIPGRLASLTRSIESQQRELSGLKSLAPVYHSYSSLRGELPELRRRVGDMTQALAAANEQVSHESESHALCDAELASGRRLVSEVGWQVCNMSQQCQELQQYLAVLQQTTGTSTAAAGRTVSDVDAELDGLESQKKQKEVALEEVMRRINRAKDERVALSEELGGVKDQLRAASEALRRRVALDNQLKEMSHQLQEACAALEAAVAAQGPAAGRRDELLNQRQAGRQEQQQLEQQMEGKIREVSNLLDALSSAQAPLDGYLARGSGVELSRNQQQLDDLARRMEENNQRLTSKENERRAEEQKLRDNQKLIVEISQSLEYRRVVAQEQQLRGQVEEARAAAGQVGDKEALSVQYASWQQQVDVLKQKAAMAQGSRQSELQAVAAAERELRAPQYADIYQRYKKSLVELKTVEMAVADLERYHKALEKALLAFHTNKMSDINKVIKELWQRTYRGQDIDAIQIRADADGSARSYNYRVVMDNGGVELDMRGRCSAGQKVLACLVIRLALAETFCLNCGILALDEPTTNLDAENSGSLAEALRAIMLARRGQENFQLIVITHDEHFARQIGTRQHAEYLWRITKDEQQHSHIAQEEIVE